MMLYQEQQWSDEQIGFLQDATPEEDNEEADVEEKQEDSDDEGNDQMFAMTGRDLKRSKTSSSSRNRSRSYLLIGGRGGGSCSSSDWGDCRSYDENGDDEMGVMGWCVIVALLVFCVLFAFVYYGRKNCCNAAKV